MNLDEIRKLSSEEIGRQLCAKLSIETYASSRGEGWRYLLNCRDSPVTILCTSLDRIAEIELLVVDKVGFDYYKTKLLYVGAQYYKSQNVFDVQEFLILTTARQRSEACLLALEEKNK